MDTIRIRGARTHNLKSVDLDLPRDRLIVVTGLSGSGKSSLAFDTIYAEGQRRYVESLSAYARQFLSMMEKPDVESIEGLSPAISIEQKSTSHNPRSTVGTVTEIYDYLRLLYARAGTPRCPTHGERLEAQTVSQMVDQVLALPEGTALILLAPVVRDRKGEHTNVMAELRAQGFIRARVDGEVCELDDPPTLDLHRKHTIEAVVDRFRVRPDLALRLAESFETALKLADGMATIAFMDEPEREPLVFSDRFACPVCGYSIAELEPRLFSFNNPAGACATCDGLGVQQFFDPERVAAHPHLSLAGGAIRGWDRRNAYYFQLIRSLAEHYGFDVETPFEQLPEKIRKVVLFGSGEESIEFAYFDGRGGMTRARTASRASSRTWSGATARPSPARCATSSPSTSAPIPARPAGHAPQRGGAPRVRRRAGPRGSHGDRGRRGAGLLQQLELPGWRGEVARKIVKEINDRLRFLVDVGLDYLTLDRSAETLSGGEAQRIRLASQIGSGLVGVMYILDEPSIGLHQRDNRRLLLTLLHLRDLGNTVIVVEHDEEAIATADHIVDIGPGAGVHGGRIVAQGSPADIMASPESLTGDYLAGRRASPCRRTAHAAPQGRGHRHPRRARQQPRRPRRRDPHRAADLRDRRLGLRQVDADQRHAVPRGRAEAQRRR
jgi:excinuclease ABC subunit A